MDGQWYVFVIRDGSIVAHPDPENIGASVTGPLGTDSTGKEFGTAIANAPEEGAWVDYAATNYANGAEEMKNSWVVKSGDLIFGSGYYQPIPAATPTPAPAAAAPTAAPADTPETGDFSLTAGWAIAIALLGALIALGGAAMVARRRGR